MAPRRKATPALCERDTNTSNQPTMSRNSNGKRKAVEVVDLTVSDDESTQPRKVPRPENLNMLRSFNSSTQPSEVQSSQTQRDPWDDEAAENGMNDVIIFSQDGAVNETLEVYGTLHTKIVGVQYYTGYATRGEHVLVRREPRNQYDANAIRVDNVQRDQIGHIPRAIAAKLAPYIDSGDLMVEGVLTDHKDFYDCPIDLILYGSADPTAQQALRRRMRSSGLPIDGLQRKDVEAARRRAEELKKVAQKPPSVKNASRRWDIGSSQGQFIGGSSQSSSQGPAVSYPSMEDIMRESQRFNPREMGQAVEKFGVGEDDLSKLPEAVCPDRLGTSLLPYQRQALAWLLEKEAPQLPARGSQDVVQLWKRNPTDNQVFTNIATNFSVKNKEPVLASGGILADDMGLGKTLEMIALIVADLASPLPGETATATLIIAPLSVMSNWSGQV
jgi:SWI/SNF-related matrix-associated actin-dependent regulator of chromatin subfamily A3